MARRTSAKPMPSSAVRTFPQWSASTRASRASGSSGRGPDQALGSAVSAGDFNGDGIPDIALTAPHAGKAPDRGRLYLIYGTSGPASLALVDVTPAFGGTRGGTEVVVRG